MWAFQSPIIHVGRDDSYMVVGEIKECEIVEKTSDLYNTEDLSYIHEKC